jgi:hypothetical protein
MLKQDVNEIRDLIARHKRRDSLFALGGLLALMIGVLTFAALFVGHGDRRLAAPVDYDFLTQLSVQTPGKRRHPFGLGRDDARDACDRRMSRSRWALPLASIWRSTRRRTG